MYGLNLKGTGLGLLACAALLAVQVGDAHAASKCRREKSELSSASKALKDVQNKSRKADKVAETSQRRLDQAIANAERKAANCEMKITRTQDKMQRELDKYENKRQKYISDLAGLTAEQATCQLGILFGNVCTNESRLLAQINKLTKTITLVEQQIASSRSRGQQRIDTQVRLCAQDSTAELKKVERATSNRDRDAAKAVIAFSAVAPKEAIFLNKEANYNLCLAS